MTKMSTVIDACHVNPFTADPIEALNFAIVV